MMAWYSRDRSSCSSLISPSRVIEVVAGFLPGFADGMALASYPEARARPVPLLAQVFVEVGDGAVPRELRCLSIEAIGGVVVEAVLRPRIDVSLFAHARGLQRRFVCRPCGDET